MMDLPVDIVNFSDFIWDAKTDNNRLDIEDAVGRMPVFIG